MTKEQNATPVTRQELETVICEFLGLEPEHVVSLMVDITVGQPIKGFAMVLETASGVPLLTTMNQVIPKAVRIEKS